jgi:hypothetical protein
MIVWAVVEALETTGGAECLTPKTGSVVCRITTLPVAL